MSESILSTFALRGIELLRRNDNTLFELLEREYERQHTTLAMVASSSIVDPSVLACEAMTTVNVTAEGYPGKRFHAGCAVIDEIEQLAIDRARAAFGAQYANVQPHSASSANEIVMFGLLNPGDTILGMDLQQGGHLTHGARVSISGRVFNAISYGLNEDGIIDYDQVRELALQHRPRLIICGATAYPRVVDFGKFREIADEADAFLLADITHIAGLVAAGLHPSSIQHAHFTTTCTHKQLYGPRGGLVLMGHDYDSPAPDGRRPLYETIQSAVFPLIQGAPNENMIAAKARAFARVMAPEFKTLARSIIDNAKALARYFIEKGYRVVSGGSDNHIVLVDFGDSELTGLIAANALEEGNIIVNKNKVPGDKRSATISSGIRLGTNSVSVRGMGDAEMKECVHLIDGILTAITPEGTRYYYLNPNVRDRIKENTAQLCRNFPIPEYPLRFFEENAASAYM